MVVYSDLKSETKKKIGKIHDKMLSASERDKKAVREYKKLKKKIETLLRKESSYKVGSDSYKRRKKK